MSVDSQYVTDSMMQSVRQSASAPTNQRVTPALMREFMKTWEDPADAHFKKHRERLFRVMELAARQRQFSAEYSVLDEASATEAELQEVYCRLVRALTDKCFKVKASSTRARAFIVSWDPVDTPESVTSSERQNPASVAAKRLRWQKRQQALGNPETRSLLEKLGFVADGVVVDTGNDANQDAPQQDKDFLGDLLAPPSTAPHRRQPTAQHRRLFSQQSTDAHQYNDHNHNNTNHRHHQTHQHQSDRQSRLAKEATEYPREVVERTKRTAQRAARIAGARGEESSAQQTARAPAPDGWSNTDSSDDESKKL